MSNKEVLLRHIKEILPVNTSHGVGEKRVIATSNDAGSFIAQIAQTKLTAGEKIEMHVHPTMNEHFFFLEGECKVNVDGKVIKCVREDYLLVPAGHHHGFEVEVDALVITVGIAID